jgi:hypothetical protein
MIRLFILNILLFVESKSIIREFNLTKTDCFVEHDQLVDECYICFITKLKSIVIFYLNVISYFIIGNQFNFQIFD